MKTLFADRGSLWRAAALGTISAMFLAGCAGGSRGLFSRSLGRHDERTISKRTPPRDPFLESGGDRLASPNDPWSDRSSRRDSRYHVAAGSRSGISERFDRNRVAITDDSGAARRIGRDLPRFPTTNASSKPRTDDPGRRDESPFFSPDQPPRNPFATVGLSRRGGWPAAKRSIGVAPSEPSAAPFPNVPLPQSTVRPGVESVIATSSVRTVDPTQDDSPRAPFPPAGTVKTATLEGCVAADPSRAATLRGGGGRSVLNPSMIVDSKSMIERRPVAPEIGPKSAAGQGDRFESFEIRIIPRQATPPGPVQRETVQPADLDRTAGWKPESNAPAVQVTATQPEFGRAGHDSDRELQWRRISPSVDRPLPTPPVRKTAFERLPKPVPPSAAAAPPTVQPATPDGCVAARPSGAATPDGCVAARPSGAATTPAAPLPFPADRTSGLRAGKSELQIADAPAVPADGAVTEAVAADSTFLGLPRWTLFAAGLLAAIAVFLRRKRRTTAAA